MTPTADRGTKPITSSAFYILLALADSARHGLGIIEDIERRTEGDVSLGPGTLYHAIRKLESAGLIAESSERPAPELDDPRRRYYSITERGREVGRREAARLDRVLQVARSKKFLRGSGPA